MANHTTFCRQASFTTTTSFSSNENRASDFIWAIPFGLDLTWAKTRGGKENFLNVLLARHPQRTTPSTRTKVVSTRFTSLIARSRWSKLVARLDTFLCSRTEGSREVDTITTTKNFSNTLGFKYDYSEKTSFDLRFSQSASIAKWSRTPINTRSLLAWDAKSVQRPI